MSSDRARPLPAVEDVGGGIWSIPVPIPDNPLGYTLVYCLETVRGPVLIDSGWQHPDSLAALRAGLRRAGTDLADCYGVLVTHHHNDHHGLSGDVRRASGCWVAMHAADARVVSLRGRSDEVWYLETVAMLVEAGADEEEIGRLPRPEEVRRARVEPPDRLLEDGELADVPDRRVRAVWTPGHTPGHLCFEVEDARVLLSGDHVLPDITPHIGLLLADEQSNPLGDYLASLERLETLDVGGVLPAHQHRFPDLRRRVRDIQAHHRTRLASMADVLASRGPLTAWQLAAAMTWHRPWETFGVMTRRSAASETLAHLRYLECAGQVRRVAGARRATRYAVVPGPERTIS